MFIGESLCFIIHSVGMDYSCRYLLTIIILFLRIGLIVIGGLWNIYIVERTLDRKTINLRNFRKATFSTNKTNDNIDVISNSGGDKHGESPSSQQSLPISFHNDNSNGNYIHNDNNNLFNQNPLLTYSKFASELDKFE